MPEHILTRDKFGPEYAVELYDPELGMLGFLVIDNTALGAGKGGIRMTSTVSLEEVQRLSRIQTWKNAMAGIPFGGAKAGMVWKGGDQETKEKFVRAFARKLAPFSHKFYVAGPDVGSGEQEMAWIVDELGDHQAATGKPTTICEIVHGKTNCGIPHEIGSTGYGVAEAVRIALEFRGIELRGATAAIHGFGNVGSFTFKFLTEMGVNVVAVSDIQTGRYLKDGLPAELFELAENRTPLGTYKDAERISTNDIFGLDVDVLIPASATDVIHSGNKATVRARIIVEGGNIPMPESIEEEFHKQGILIIPDFIANAGGVISSAAEYEGQSIEEMFRLVKSNIHKNTHEVLKKSKKSGESLRKTGLRIAKERVEEAMSHSR